MASSRAARLGPVALAALLAAAAASAAAAQDGRAQDGRAQDGAAQEPAIQSIDGKRYKMASAKMANSVTRFADASGDQALPDGSPVAEAPAWSDISAVYVAPTRMPAKLVNKMSREYPPGTAGAFYGEEYDLRRKDRVVFVAVKMDGRLPDRARGQQVEVGFGGNAATPAQAGSAGDSLAGLETFTLGGLFGNGAYATGTTDVGGREPGTVLEAADYYNVDAGAFGFYAPARQTWYLVIPRAGDADAITVSVLSTTDEGQVVDRLELPGGGRFVDLRDPTGGFTARGSRSPLTCRALETFSAASDLVELTDPGASLIRYTAGSVVGTAPARATELVAAAAEVAGPVAVLLKPVGVEAPGPLEVEGELAISEAGDVVTLSFEAPAGQWTFALADEEQPLTPAGERIVDHVSLTGTAGVRTGPGLDGIVAGDPSCGADAG